MSFWNRLFGKAKEEPAPVRELREIPDGAMRMGQILRCDPAAGEPDRRFMVGSWTLAVAEDADSQRLARGVLKKSAGKTLRLEPTDGVGHRGVISAVVSAEQGGYKWIYVDVDLRAGSIRLHQGSGEHLH